MALSILLVEVIKVLSANLLPCLGVETMRRNFLKTRVLHYTCNFTAQTLKKTPLFFSKVFTDMVRFPMGQRVAKPQNKTIGVELGAHVNTGSHYQGESGEKPHALNPEWKEELASTDSTFT